METLDPFKNIQYKRVTKRLALKCQTIASLIILKMDNLGITEFEDLQVKPNISDFQENPFKIYRLVFKDSNNPGNLLCTQSGSGNHKKGVYLVHDKSYFIRYADNKEVLRFMNNSEYYLKKLNELLEIKFS